MTENKQDSEGGHTGPDVRMMRFTSDEDRQERLKHSPRFPDHGTKVEKRPGLRRQADRRQKA